MPKLTKHKLFEVIEKLQNGVPMDLDMFHDFVHDVSGTNECDDETEMFFTYTMSFILSRVMVNTEIYKEILKLYKQEILPHIDISHDTRFQILDCTTNDPKNVISTIILIRSDNEKPPQKFNPNSTKNKTTKKPYIN